MSSRRPRRKCAKTTYVSTIPDEYLVGYVEDGENIDMIMKKFEVLEQLEKEGPIKGEQREGEQVLTEEQLKDVFRLTSNFTAESVLDDDASRSDLDFYYDYFVSEEACGEDYFAEDEIWDEDVDDDDDLDFFPSDGRKRKRMSRSTGQQPSYGGNKFISCEVTGEDGFLYTVRKKVRNVDPNLPTYTRIPPEPIPLSWAKRVQPFRPPQSGDDLQNNIHLFRSASEVLSADLAKLGRFQGLLIDPPWQLPNEPRDPNRITPEQFSKLKITDKVIPKGLIFIWAPKELIAQTLKTMGRWGFLYVENLVWVKKAVNNKTVAQPYKYFSRAKESLLIFRKFCAAASANQQNHHSSRSSGSQKEWQLELRHQRNPDVVFDFVKPKKHSAALGEEEKPEFVYHVIETLLPEANYDLKTGRGMFLELWGKPSSCRKGWTVVSIQPDQAD